MAELKAGSRWRSVTGTTEVVVVKAPAGAVALRCGGQPMVPHDAEARAEASAEEAGETILVGKRYADEGGSAEVLCTKPGAGPLALDGVVLTVKGAKPLPSSD